MTDKKTNEETETIEEAVKGLGDLIGDDALMALGAALGRRLPEDKRKETFQKFSNQAINELVHKLEILRHTTGLVAGAVKVGIFASESTVYNITIDCKEFESESAAKDWMQQCHEKAKADGEQYQKENPDAI